MTRKFFEKIMRKNGFIPYNFGWKKGDEKIIAADFRRNVVLVEEGDKVVKFNPKEFLSLWNLKT